MERRNIKKRRQNTRQQPGRFGLLIFRVPSCLTHHGAATVSAFSLGGFLRTFGVCGGRDSGASPRRCVPFSATSLLAIRRVEDTLVTACGVGGQGNEQRTNHDASVVKADDQCRQ